MKQMLERLFDPDKLEELLSFGNWVGTDAGEGHHSRDSGRRTSDGTFDAVEKEILIASYLRKDRNKSQLADPSI